jgi:hypothetical protein
MTPQEQYDLDLAAWKVLEAEYNAALPAYNLDLAAYQVLLAQYQLDQAAYDAAVLEESQYPGELAWRQSEIRNTFVLAVGALKPILFSTTWAGPWGYAGQLWSWTKGTASTLPATVTDPHTFVRSMLVKASMPTAEWDTHVGSVTTLAYLRANPPGPIPQQPVAPVAPTAPIPPGPPPTPPPPPTTGTATYKADPAGYTIVATNVRKATTAPIRDLWAIAKNGDVIELASGDYPRCDLKPVTSRPAGGARVTFRGPATGARARITRNPEVGGSDTLQMLQGVADSCWENIDVLSASRAGIKTTDSKNADGTWSGTGPNHTFRGVRVLGGWNPTIAGEQDPGFTRSKDCLWGVHLYTGGNFLFEDCLFQGIYKEHVGGYGHNNQGDYVYRRCIFRWAGRTATQWMSRTSEGPIAKGNITLEDCEAYDVCLEGGGGGSAFTFRGGAPNTEVFLTRCKVRLGCDAALMYPYSENITGAVVVDSGQYAYPGGTKAIHLDGCDFEIGSVYGGVGGARRTNCLFESVGQVTINNCRIVQGPKAHTIALEFGPSVGAVKFTGTNVVVGRVVYQGMTYQTFDAFKAAKPALFS